MCEMNWWDSMCASCSAPEEKERSEDVEDRAKGNGRGGLGLGGGGGGGAKGANKLSYRDILFHPDGKMKPPFSEKSTHVSIFSLGKAEGVMGLAAWEALHGGSGSSGKSAGKKSSSSSKGGGDHAASDSDLDGTSRSRPTGPLLTDVEAYMLSNSYVVPRNHVAYEAVEAIRNGTFGAYRHKVRRAMMQQGLLKIGNDSSSSSSLSSSSSSSSCRRRNRPQPMCTACSMLEALRTNPPPPPRRRYHPTRATIRRWRGGGGGSNGFFDMSNYDWAYDAGGKRCHWILVGSHERAAASETAPESAQNRLERACLLQTAARTSAALGIWRSEPVLLAVRLQMLDAHR